MPVTMDDLRRYRSVYMFDDETLGDALGSLADQNGYDFWYLVVERTGGGFAACEYSALKGLLEAQGESALALPLKSLINHLQRQDGQKEKIAFPTTERPMIPVTRVLESSGVSVDLARAEAAASASNIAVILEGDDYLGLLPGDITRAGAFDGGLLAMAGQYASFRNRPTLRPRPGKGPEKPANRA